MATLEDLASAVERGKKKEALPLLEQALAEGAEPQAILNECLIPTMDRIGEKFSRNELFIPEILIAARTMAACTDVLKQHLGDGGTSLGKAVIGTVAGDMHDIGKNLVKMLLESKGFEVTDLGVDVAAETFVDHVKNNPDCKLVCLSSLLTTTMPAMDETIRAFADAGLRDQVKIMIGGAPITQEFADHIGADAYTPDAGACAAKAAEMMIA